MEKHYTRYIFLSFICLIVFLLCPINSIAASLYNITDIGSLKLKGNDYQNLKIKINDNNKVVGWHRENSLNNSPSIGFTWDVTNGFQEPITNNLEHQFLSNNISDFTVGFTYDSNNTQVASMWDTTYNTQTTLNSLGGIINQANDINTSNRIAGDAIDTNGKTQAVYWDNNVLTLVPIDHPNGDSADVINNNNWIAGLIKSEPFQAYVWDGTETHILNTINTDISKSWASDLNNLNQLVGGMELYQTPGSTNQRFLRTQAYSWDKTNGFTNLGKNIIGSSTASAINDKQHIVGRRTIDILDRQAVLWENSIALNLREITLNNENWKLEDATDININGNIVGIGKYNDVYHAFLLEPSGGTTTTSDLEINLSTSNASNKARAVNAAENQALKFSITNHGPDDANNVIFESTLDTLLSVSEISIAKGECTINNEVINCVIPSLVLNESVDLLLKLNTDAPNDYQIEAHIVANEIDAGINSNNYVTKTVNVISQAHIQQSPAPGQGTSTDESSESPDSDENNAITPQDISSAGGCSLGRNQVFDPLLYLLLIISILKISHTSLFRKRNTKTTVIN